MKGRSELTGTGNLKVASILAIIVMLIAGAALPVFAEDDISVSISMYPERLFLGDKGYMDVVVSGTTEGEVSAELPLVSGFSISGPSVQRNSQTSFVNGRITYLRTVTLKYTIIPLNPGRIEIPAFSVSVGKKKLTAGPASVHVSKPPSDETVKLQALISNKECWIGESVDVSYLWLVAENIEDYDYYIPLLAHMDDYNLDLARIDPSVLPGSVIPGQGAGGERVRLPISGYDVISEKFTREIAGSDYTIYASTFRFFPPGPGEVSLATPQVKAKIKTGTKLVYDNFWGRNKRVPEYKTAYASGNMLTLVVHDLPTEGRPAGFTGAVGDFSIQISAEESVIKVGDPLRLKIKIRGEGLLERIERPLISELPDFEVFHVNENLEPGEIDKEEESITFEQVIRPKNHEINEIPSVPFSFFDTEEGIFRTAASDPVPLKVLPTKVVTAEDVFMPGSVGQPAVEKLEVEARKGRIHANYRHPDILKNQDLSAALFLPGVLFPPSLYFFLMTVVRRKRRLAGDTGFVRSKKATREAFSIISKAKKVISRPDEETVFFDLLASSIKRFISDKLNLGHGELTRIDMMALSGEGRLPEDSLSDIIEVLEICDTGRFGGGGLTREEKEELVSSVETLLMDLAKKI